MRSFMLLYASCWKIPESWCCVQQMGVMLELRGILLTEELSVNIIPNLNIHLEKRIVAAKWPLQDRDWMNC